MVNRRGKLTEHISLKALTDWEILVTDQLGKVHILFQFYKSTRGANLVIHQERNPRRTQPGMGGRGNSRAQRLGTTRGAAAAEERRAKLLTKNPLGVASGYSSASRCTDQSHPWLTLSSSVVARAKAPRGLGQPVRRARAVHGHPQRWRGRARGRHRGVVSGEEQPLELVGIARRSC